MSSEEFAMHHAGLRIGSAHRASIFILLARDAQMVEGRERGKHGAANPSRMLPLRVLDDLDHVRAAIQQRQLVVQSLGKTCEASTRMHK